MAVNAGEVSVALTMDDAAFLAGLEAARASLNDFARALAELAAAPAGGAPSVEAPDAFAQFAEAGAQAGAAFEGGVAAAIGAAGAAATAADGLAGAVRAALGAADASAEGARLAQSYADGIAQGAPSVSAGAAALAQAAGSAARGGLSGASALGRGFSAGLAAGIRAGRSGVVNAAASVARAAAEAARGALSIHSPSKVTQELGEFFDLGFVRGVEGMTPRIERAVRAAVYIAPPTGAISAAAEWVAPEVRVRGPAIDYDALAEAMDRRQMVLNMNGRRVAEVQERETARVQSMRGRRVALGYGK